MRMFAAAFAIGLLACSTPQRPTSSSYDSGFADGCASASAETSAIPRRARRDEQLYAKDPDYRSGWISGSATCRAQGGPPRL
jgi:hypothetical protein